MQKANNTSDRSPTHLHRSLSSLRGRWCLLITFFFFFLSLLPPLPAASNCYAYTRSFLQALWSGSPLPEPRQPAGPDLLAGRAGQRSLSAGRDGWVEPCGACDELWVAAEGAAEVTGGKLFLGLKSRKKNRLLLGLASNSGDRLCSSGSLLICTPQPASLRAADHPGLLDK